MAIQVFTAGQILTAAQMNTLQTTMATYNAIGYRASALSINTSLNTAVVDNTNFTGTITAVAGDLLQATWASFVSTGANLCAFNFYTFNGATAVNPFIVPTSFNPFLLPTLFEGAANFTALYKVVAGDIFTSQVTVKLTGNSAGNARTVVNASVPAQFTITNLGQVQ